MSVSIDLPEKCQKCAKTTVLSTHKNCEFCLDIELQEEVLCYLNRCIQDPREFKCHAFQPILKLVGPSKSRVTNLHDRLHKSLKKETIRRFLKSDKIKYQKALALQKLKDDPNGVFIDLKYHFAWNVIHRKPVFKPNDDTFDFFYDIFLNCNELVGGFVRLLRLAPDHVHLYVNSDGEHSVETIAQEIKRYSNKAILSDLADIKERLNGEIDLWDVSYLSQTIG